MLSDLLYRLRALFRRGEVEAEMDDELRFHFDQEVNKYEKRGLPHEEALRRARLAFGGMDHAKDECRESRGVWFVEVAIQDLRHSLRRLLRSPGFTAVAVITLALGIGATTAIFSVVNGVLLKPLPYPHPGRLVDVRLNLPGIHQNNWPISEADYFIFREQSRTLQDVGLYSGGRAVNITGLGKPERVPALRVTDGLLPILEVKPLLGRLFTRTDDSPGAADTVILTYGYWRRKFGGDRSVIGKTIDVDGTSRAIIGVLPQSFRFLDKTKLALLLPIPLNRATTYLLPFFYGAIARLKPEVTLAQANEDVARMLPIVERSFPPSPGFSRKVIEDARIRPNLRPLKEDIVGDVGKLLWVLMGGVGLVLLIACANVANLLQLRVEGRRQELAIRAALGASRGRIARELLSESFLLTFISSALGLGITYVALRALTFIAPANLPRVDEIGLDGAVVLFTLAVSLLAALGIAVISILKYAGASFGTGLREGGRSPSESRERHRSRGILVIVQVALALVLLVSSGLMIRTFHALTEVHPGFDAPSEVQTFRVDIPDAQMKDPARVVHTQKEIARKLKTIPGVSSASFSVDIPMDGSGWTDSVIAKDRPDAPGELSLARYEFAAPGLFKTLGTPLVVGRDFTWDDVQHKAQVAIVSEKFAREYWRSPSRALGKQIRGNTKDEWREVVGVVRDIHQDGVDKQAPASVYWPMFMTQFAGVPDWGVRRNVAFVIRSSRVGSESFINEVRQAVWSVDPDLPMADIHTLDYYYTKSMARTSFTLVMLALAGGMALLLGIVGLYGVIAYSVSQRKHEIGIRMALGAQKCDVLRLVAGQGLILALLGVGIGIVLALGLTRFLAGLLYGVKPSDPLTFAAVSALLITVALVASYIPARQSAQIDPAMALRHQ